MSCLHWTKRSPAILFTALCCFSFAHGQGANGNTSQRADSGDAQAQYDLGEMYSQGRGVPQDYAEAARWYRMAAEKGNPEAQDRIGFMYYNGRGVSQDYSEAARWTRKAADQGNAQAQLHLGDLYHHGEGTRQDNAEAARWYRKSAEQGQLIAQFDLGVMYNTGQGVTQDYVEAHMWFNLAASKSNGEDRKRDADARDAVAQKMTPQQIAEAQRRAREWKSATTK